MSYKLDQQDYDFCNEISKGNIVIVSLDVSVNSSKFFYITHTHTRAHTHKLDSIIQG